MSQRETGCFSFLFGSCYRKKAKQRNAVSVEHSGVNDRIKEIATQTQDQVLRSSAPASMFPSAHKPIIAFRDSKGFRIQSAKRERLVIKNDEFSHDQLSSVPHEDIESIQSELNDEPLLSSRSIQRLFSPSSSNSSRVIPNLFKWDNNSARPRLLPITPEQFIKKKIIPANRPIKPLERMRQNANLVEDNKE